MGNGITKTEKSSSNEHGKIDTNGLQYHTDNHDEKANRDAVRLPRISVSNVRNDWKGNDRSNGHNGIE